MNEDIKRIQDELVDKMGKTPFVRPMGKPDDPPGDDFRDLTERLKTLSGIQKDLDDLEIRREELQVRREEAGAKLEEARLRADAESYRAVVEDRKSRREVLAKQLEKVEDFILGGCMLAFVTALEEGRLLKSTGDKIVLGCKFVRNLFNK